MIELEKSPAWIKSLINSLSSTQQFILFDNIYDFYLCYDKEYGYVTFSLMDFLAKHLQQTGCDNVLSFEPIKGFSLLYGNKEYLKELNFSFETSECMEVKNLNEAYILIKNLLNSKDYTNSIVLNFASFLKDLSFSKNDYIDFLFNLFRDSLNLNPINKNQKSIYNQIIFILKDLKDIPNWYYNPKIKYIKIPKPNREIRKKIIKFLLSNFDTYMNFSENKKEMVVNELVYLTFGMHGKEVLNILLEAKKNKTKNIIDFVQTRKLNSVQNPWSISARKSLENTIQELKRFNYILDELNLNKIISIIKSAYYNFSNIEREFFLDKPRSSMFFYGYHQEEQMSVVHLLAKTIFKDQDSCLIVDMKNCLSLSDLLNLISSHLSNYHYGTIMFQNIQRANKDVLQTLFNIIKYGKIFTNKSTLYFHGYIIVFSYNKSCDVEGLNKQNIINNEKEIKNFFKNTDNSSELYFEFKNSIIQFTLFDRVRAEKYLEKMLDETIEKIKIFHKVSIILDNEAKKEIVSQCLNEKEFYCSEELKSILHNTFIAPLTDLFFEKDLQKNNTFIIKGLKENKFKAVFV